jgi:transcriptional regulator with XRE-family HTH domain
MKRNDILIEKISVPDGIFPYTTKEAKELKITDKGPINKEMHFPKVMRERRNEKGYSQQTAADSIGVTKSTIGLYENGDNIPDIKTLYKISKLYDVSVGYLLGIDPVPTSNMETQDICKITGLSGTVIDKIIEFQDYTIVGLNALLKSQYAANILSAIYSASEIKDYSGEDLFKFNDIRTRHIQKACEEALLQENLINVARSVDILAELEYSPKKQAEYMAQKYLTLLIDEISKK